MKRLKGGPELKMPDLKVPTFLSDIYWDLHDRRLLPLVGLIVAAIVAVPFLMGGGSEEAPQGQPQAAALLKREIANASTITVVRADPGLRDYRKRLARRKPTDPFKAKFEKPKGNGSQLPEPAGGSSGTTVKVGEESSGGGGSTGTPVSTPASPGGGGGSTGGDSGGGSGKGGSGGGSTGGGGGGSNGGGSNDGGGSKGGTAKKPHLTYFSYAVNVRISRSGGKSPDAKKKTKPAVKHRVLPQTSLPGEKAPVVTYLGPARKGKKATGKVLLLVSNKVQSVFGESKCVVGDDVCQLLEVEPGFPVTFVYGANEVHYTINVLKVELVVTGHS